MKYNIAYISAYVAGNLGDDLFIELLCNRYPNQKFIILASNKYKDYFSHIKNLKYISINHYLWKAINKFEILYLISQLIISRFIDLNILVTGSIFEESGNYKKNIRKKKYNLKLFRVVYYLSCSMGEFRNERFIKECTSVFSKVKDVCFRDTYSYELFKELGNVRVESDLIYQLKYESKKTEDYIVISVIDLEKRSKLSSYENVYLNKLVEIIEFMVNEGDKVVLMGFCENERDHIGIEKIKDKLPEYCRSQISDYMHKNIQQSLDVISKSKGVVATRFHSFILAYVMKKPMYNIIYSSKTKNAINDLEAQVPFIDISELKFLNVSAVQNSLRSKPVYSEVPFISAKRQFNGLDELLQVDCN